MSGLPVSVIKNGRQTAPQVGIGASTITFDSISYTKVAATRSQIQYDKVHFGGQTIMRGSSENWRRIGKLAFHYRFLGNVVPAAKNFPTRHDHTRGMAARFP
jgi:hypothetical protein